MEYFLGVDIVSISCDTVLIDENENILATHVVPTGAKNKEAIARATDAVLDEVKISTKILKPLYLPAMAESA